MTKLPNWLKFLTAVLGCQLVGITSGLFTISAIPAWYATINKPVFSPPNWVFGPVWTTLYLMMGIAAYLIWSGKGKKRARKAALQLFLYQLLLNFFWSILFFGLKSPTLAMLDIVGLWLLILINIKAFWKISKPAAWLMIPYLLWVSFASVLNASIVILN